MSRRAGWWLLVLAPVIAHAEPVYVVDQVIVSVANAPESEAPRIATVRSGEQLELLGRQSGQAHVRLSNGTEGWIKAAYLSAEPPAQRRLMDKAAEAEKLRQDVGRLQAELASAHAAAVSVAAAAAPAPDGIAADPGAGSDPLPARDCPGPGTSWQRVLGASVVMFGLGFVLGWRMLDRRIRQKFGGLRIY